MQRFLREELAHRQGNTLAVVLALAEQIAVHAASLDETKADFAGRLSALAAVNATLNAEGPDVSLAGLFEAVAQCGGLAARLGGSGGGATLRPKAAITLGLMFHELLQISNTGARRSIRFDMAANPGTPARRVSSSDLDVAPVHDFDQDGETSLAACSITPSAMISADAGACSATEKVDGVLFRVSANPSASAGPARSHELRGPMRVLVVEDETLVLFTLEAELRRAEFEVVMAGNAAGARAHLDEEGTDLNGLVVDLNLSAEETGLNVSRHARAIGLEGRRRDLQVRQ